MVPSVIDSASSGILISFTIVSSLSWIDCLFYYFFVLHIPKQFPRDQLVYQVLLLKELLGMYTIALLSLPATNQNFHQISLFLLQYQPLLFQYQVIIVLLCCLLLD